MKYFKRLFKKSKPKASIVRKDILIPAELVIISIEGLPAR